MGRPDSRIPVTDLFPPRPDDWREHEPEHRAERRRRADRAAVGRGVGWLLLAGAVVGVLVLGSAPAPYVIERPGPVFDTLGEVSVGDEAVPLIEVDGAETYPTEGQLDLLTVRIQGSPQSPPSWIDIATAWFQSSHSVVPVEAVYPPGQSDEEADEQSALEMQTSQQEAVAAALAELGVDYSSVVLVADVEPDAPAAGVLEPGDEILAAGGVPTPDVSVLREEIGANGVDDPIELTIRREGEERAVEVTPEFADDGETAVIGIYVGGRYDFPFDVTIQLENVGGPSAGMMFALGIYDTLTPGALTGGEHVAGTGTITAGGDVGPIGGIRQKMYGAEAAGADWFLAPFDNCGQVVDAIPEGLEVFAVSTLDEALAVVEAIGTGGDLGGFARCSG